MTGSRQYVRDYSAALGRIEGSGTRESRMQHVVDVLWDALKDTGVSWVGFYLDQPGAADDRRLVLGPCRDRPACSPIGLHGACGQALLAKRALIVRDVAELGAGYIACDPRDRSELILPLHEVDGACWGVLDLDSSEVGAFDASDVHGLERLLVAARLTVTRAHDSAPE